MRLRIDDDTRFEYSGSVDTGTNPRSAESAASRSIRYTPTRLLEPLLCNSDARLLTNCWYWSVPVRFEAFRCFWTRTICDEKSLRESSVACFSTDPLMTYMENKDSNAAVSNTTSIDTATVLACNDRRTCCLSRCQIHHTRWVLISMVRLYRRGYELVSDPAHGLHDPRILRIGLHLHAQPLHMHVDQSGISATFVSPNTFQQVRTAQASPA